MRARWIETWDGPLLDGERPDPEPGPNEVLVEVEACGVGLTVLNCIRGDLGDDPADLPRIPGHELVGTVSSVGAGADPELAGRRVLAYFYLCCGRCRRCRSGQESLCERLAGYVGVDRDGGYAERVALPVRERGSAARRDRPGGRTRRSPTRSPPPSTWPAGRRSAPASASR